MKKAFIVIAALLVLSIIFLLFRKVSAPSTPTEDERPTLTTDESDPSTVPTAASVSPSVDQSSGAQPTEKNTPVQERQNATIINGIPLNDTQKQLVRDTYGVESVPGTFWYDSATGAFGLIGEGISGIMLPGHSFGTLRADASGGTSGVYINGRQLTNQEVAALSAITGSPGIPGRYWMDALGNVGIEGSGVPLLNLYALASAAGGSGGGDNFWSSSFSAGNYGPGNTYGYVSVPGVGPVDYGF